MTISTQQAADKGIRTVLLAILANTMLALAKGLAGVLGHSYALIADAVESIMDVFSSLVVWGGLKIAATPPDSEHPYGHGKAEPLAAAVVALSLMAAALGIAIQSVRELLAPTQGPAAFTLFVLIAVVVIKESMFRLVSRVGREIQSTAVRSDAWHHRSDAITSLAAFIGIGIAQLGGGRYDSADEWAALFASGIIAYNGCRLLRPAIAELMDSAPSEEVEAAIRRVAGAVTGVSGLDKCYVRKMGFDFLVDIHVEVDGAMSVRRGHEIAHEVKAALRRANPKILDVLVHIEPAPLAVMTNRA